MKTLFLIRHAKSGHGDPALPDRDRPLDPCGKKDLVKMAGRLAERGVKPQLILSSPATRALTTAQGFARKLDYPKQEIRVEERLYSGHVRDLLDVLHGVGDDVHRVFLVAHNPHLTQLAQQLCGDIGHLPPCAIAEFTFDAKSWADVGETKARRSRLECPYEAST